MKKIKLALITLFSMITLTSFASDFEYTISGVYGNGRQFSIKNDLPPDFLDKEQTVEKEFEITDGPSCVNGKYLAQFYNSIEHYPKRKVVIFLSKLNPRNKKFELLNKSFYFFEDTKFWFVEQIILNKDILALGISHKKYFD